MKRIIFIMIFLMASPAWAAMPRDWARKDWTIQEIADGRVLYYTRGNEVENSHLGFIKTKGACGGDILWISYVSADKKVQEFVSQAATLAFNIDGTEFKIDLGMLAVNTVFISHNMIFTNFLAGPQLIEMMTKGRKAILRITAPKELVAHLDTPQETFSLMGFTAARKMADSLCRGEAITKKRSKGANGSVPATKGKGK